MKLKTTLLTASILSIAFTAQARESFYNLRNTQPSISINLGALGNLEQTATPQNRPATTLNNGAAPAVVANPVYNGMPSSPPLHVTPGSTAKTEPAQEIKPVAKPIEIIKPVEQPKTEPSIPKPVKMKPPVMANPPKPVIDLPPTPPKPAAVETPAANTFQPAPGPKVVVSSPKQNFNDEPNRDKPVPAIVPEVGKTPLPPTAESAALRNSDKIVSLPPISDATKNAPRSVEPLAPIQTTTMPPPQNDPNLPPPPKLVEAKPSRAEPKPLIKAEPEFKEPKPLPKAEPEFKEPKPLPKAEPEFKEPKPVVKAEPVFKEPKPVVKAEPEFKEPKPMVKAEPDFKESKLIAKTEPEIKPLVAPKNETVKETTIKETTVKEAQIKEIPAKETTVKEVIVKETPAKFEPVKKIDPVKKLEPVPAPPPLPKPSVSKTNDESSNVATPNYLLPSSDNATDEPPALVQNKKIMEDKGQDTKLAMNERAVSIPEKPVAAEPKPAPVPKIVSAPKPALKAVASTPAPVPPPQPDFKSPPAQNLDAPSASPVNLEKPTSRELPPLSTLFDDKKSAQQVMEAPAPAAAKTAPEPTGAASMPNKDAVMVQPLQLAKNDTPAASPASNATLSMIYGETATEIPDAEKTKLNGIASQLAADKSSKITVIAYASGTPDQVSQAKRTALARAFAIRSYLLEHNISPDQMVIKPLGNKSESGVPDRVDLFILKNSRS